MQGIDQILNSVEVAGMIEKDHKLLMRDIRRYTEQLYECKIEPVDFFMKSSYVDAKGETRPCYRITRKGCEFIANKLTGNKGTIFTARYINRFHEMESILSEQTSAVAPVQPERVAQIEQEYAELKKEIRGIKSDLKRIGRSGGLQITAYVSGYRKDISDMVMQINNERFLKAIYISVRDYLKENGSL